MRIRGRPLDLFLCYVFMSARSQFGNALHTYFFKPGLALNAQDSTDTSVALFAFSSSCPSKPACLPQKGSCTEMCYV